MENYLTLSAEPDVEDGAIRLTLSFVSGQFAGEGHAYFEMRRIDAFSSALSRFPIAQSEALEGGYLETGEEGLRQVHLGIRITPAERGLLRLHLTVAQPWDDVDMPNFRSLASHHFLIDHEALSKLQRSIAAMCSGDLPTFRIDFPDHL